MAETHGVDTPAHPIERHIHTIRGQRVMLDAELAALYGVPTKVFNQAVRRNIERFPADFMFQLSKHELDHWRSQVVTSNPAAKMGLRRSPYAFTQEGVGMLSAVLRSPRAVQTSIFIMTGTSRSPVAVTTMFSLEAMSGQENRDAGTVI
jgi:hypothetical protein